MFIVVVLCLHVTCLVADSLTPASIRKPSLDNDDGKLSFLSLSFFFLPMHIHFPRHYMNVGFISFCLSKPMTRHIILLLLVVASFTSAVPVYQEPGVLYLPDNAIVLGA